MLFFYSVLPMGILLKNQFSDSLLNATNMLDAQGDFGFTQGAASPPPAATAKAGRN
jgi:hypothetical protein